MFIRLTDRHPQVRHDQRFGLGTCALVALLALATACSAEDEIVVGNQDATSDAQLDAADGVVGGDTGNGDTGSGDTGSGDTGGGDTTEPCITAQDCPAISQACRVVGCVEGLCAAIDAPVGTPCDDGDLCTGPGTCDAGGCSATVATDCDDGNPCTNDGCGAAGCNHTPLDAPCDDGSACTAGDACKGGACLPGAATACDDGNPCTTDGCDAKAGCTFDANTLGCDDGDACTEADACNGGSCKGKPLGDGACDDGNPCTQDSCDSAGGKGCSHVALTASADTPAPCSDSNVCTEGDACSDGACKPGKALNCDDGNPCTSDGCDAVGGCASVALTSSATAPAPCDDGNPCTTGDACSNGGCNPGPALGCSDGNPCTDDTCAPVDPGDGGKPGGCVHTANAAPCDDGNICTVADGCKGGVCLPGASTACNDGNPCTNDSCDPSGQAAGNTSGKAGCLHVDNALPCGDGDPCTGGDACSGGTCQSGATVSCDDGNPCTDDSCDPTGKAPGNASGKAGCVHAANIAGCNDGNICTEGDSCSGGVCQPGAAKACDDGNACTTDSCDPSGKAPGNSAGKAGCVQVANSLACNDGDVCSLGDVCSNGSCTTGKPLACDDGNPCTQDSCVSAGGKGCSFAPLTAGPGSAAPCDDSNVCTQGDGCGNGVCLPGAATSCDDGNPCTTDSCDAKQGCSHGSNSAPCDDGSVCTVGDQCQGGVCKPGAKQPCNDGNACTDDTCDAKAGCLSKANSSACDDGNPCTAGDACAQGSCSGLVVDCDDKDACTVDLCDPNSKSAGPSACNHLAPPGVTSCNGSCVQTSNDPKNCGGCGKVCDPGALCQASTCVPIVCVPNGTAPCYSGPSATLGVGACTAGQKTCNSTGTAWLPGCKGEVLPASAEDCNTQADDDCDGKANPASICGPAEYIFGQAPDCGSYCYYDEPHNVLVSGNKADNTKVGTYAVGQLVDGVKGHDGWSDDLGKGPAYEWVGFVQGKPVLTFRLPKVTELAKIVIGLNNQVYGGVNQPSVIEVETSVDGSTWSAKTAFSQGDGSMAKIPSGKRADITLDLGKTSCRYIRLSITRVSWVFIDEVAFE